jgi:hypothetical protein
MRRIPFGSNASSNANGVFDNLVAAPQLLIADQC